VFVNNKFVRCHRRREKPFCDLDPRSDVEEMKVPPISLTGCGAGLPPPLHFSPDFLWRYPNPFFQPPPSPLESQLKAHLPGGLGSDPRLWLRDDVMVFLRYCEREFDLEKIDMDKFQMNGKKGSAGVILTAVVLIWPLPSNS
jgi:Sterile alpha motif (SAM)/Pointed domain